MATVAAAMHGNDASRSPTPTTMTSSSAVAESAKVNGSQGGPPAETAENFAATETTRASGETSKEEHRPAAADAPLPTDLHNILAEVARTGSCSSLPWTTSEGKASVAASLPVSTIGNATASTNSSSTTKYALGLAVSANRDQNRRHYTHSNRLSISSPHYPAAGGPGARASRKKHRNGIQVNRRRLAEAAGGGSKTQTGTTASRKRPLYLIRASATSSAGVATGMFSPGSVGSGRTSGSEPDDSTQYECDSEGTSATSCSELSAERKDNQRRNMHRVAKPASKVPPSAVADEVSSSPHGYRCLKDVLQTALGLVLDFWYNQKGGYKLSPAEKRRIETYQAEKASPKHMNGDNGTLNGHSNPDKIASEFNGATQTGNRTEADKLSKSPHERIFQQRRQRLLMMLGQSEDKVGPSSIQRFRGGDEGAPFTIQRIAEVLIAPERYYTQTHKLCNCLEKLLLVTSSTRAFGGSTGGITSQSRLEERELAALADERGRLETEFRQRALKRRNSSLSDDLPMDTGVEAGSRPMGSSYQDEAHGGNAELTDNSPGKQSDKDINGTESSSREMLEAAARSLRTKFDHVGIDPHSSAAGNRDVRSIAENRGMTNSPPPPSLAMSGATASNIPLPGHAGVGNFVRQHLPEQGSEHTGIARVPSPILFSQGNEQSGMASLHAAPNMHGILHVHHAPLGGVSMGSTPFDVVSIEGANTPNAPGLTVSGEGADLEGRSSASNSDIDSESDDVSFDDSASDRSDGSDTGPGHYEPFTAARAMALNRIQQQQRLQSRVLTSQALHQSEGGGFRSEGEARSFRPPADSEYQSGDSIDSTRGEDSGGSDSSSSDVAD